MNGKLIALALGISTGLAGTAWGAISPGDGAANNPPGELFLTVWDPVNLVSYTRDLGITVVDLANNPNQSMNFAPDGLYTSTFGTVDPATLVYSVAGFNARFDDFPCCYGMVVSSNSNQSQVFIPDFTALATALATGGYYAAGVNADAGDVTNYAANVSALSHPDSPGYYDGDNWGGSIGLTVPFQTGAAVGTPAKAYSLLLGGDGFTVFATLLDAEWALAADGTLTFAVADADGDGVSDRTDNCTQVANADQLDTDHDGFGNVCDADFNGDCIVDGLDLYFMRGVLHTPTARADLTGDGIVDGRDVQKLQFELRGLPPGPSGATNACKP